PPVSPWPHGCDGGQSLEGGRLRRIDGMRRTDSDGRRPQQGDPMMFTATAWLLATTAAAFLPASGGKPDARPSAQGFLQKAAEGQQAEIALGELASERAGNQEVKQFGAQMI